MLIKKNCAYVFLFIFFITIRITYEEYCINFSSILISPKKFYRHIKKKKFLEKLKISVYLQLIHYLNNNKYLKSFEDKSLSLRYLLLERKLMENLVFYKHKHFFDFSTTKLLANFRDFDILFLRRNLVFNYQVFLAIRFFLTTHQKKILRKIENFCGLKITQKKSKYFENLAIRFCVKIPVFPSLFFFVFLVFFKTVGKCLLLTFIMHQEYSLCQRKPPPKFEIEELFRLESIYCYMDGGGITSLNGGAIKFILAASAYYTTTQFTLCVVQKMKCVDDNKTTRINILQIFYKLYEIYKSDNMFFVPRTLGKTSSQLKMNNHAMLTMMMMIDDLCRMTMMMMMMMMIDNLCSLTTMMMMDDLYSLTTTMMMMDDLCSLTTTMMMMMMDDVWSLTMMMMIGDHASDEMICVF
ncbi:hypothetical protein AGLY_018162 [Aphis glycines]|uniref:Uncharacterized protein n=1 Tax=Aphis glycines TaxID=307491 RepID=A0A6G0STM4_APHGL|nr:hypothetical protein AGLY_018162 [Aphis glycines]